MQLPFVGYTFSGYNNDTSKPIHKQISLVDGFVRRSSSMAQVTSSAKLEKRIQFLEAELSIAKSAGDSAEKVRYN